MRVGLLKATAASLVVLFGVGCGAEAPPAGPDVTPDAPIDPDEPDPEQREVPLMLQEALGEFGQCMRLEVWMRSGIYMLPTVETDENDECVACHSDNTAGITLQSDDIVATFDYHTQMPAVMRLVTGTVDERGNFKDLVPSNRYVEKGVDSCPPEETGIVCHPSYTLPVTMQEAVSEFVSVTLENWNAGTCDAPYIKE